MLSAIIGYLEALTKPIGMAFAHIPLERFSTSGGADHGQRSDAGTVYGRTRSSFAAGTVGWSNRWATADSSRGCDASDLVRALYRLPLGGCAGGNGLLRPNGPSPVAALGRTWD